MTKYKIYDENGELFRIVNNKYDLYKIMEVCKGFKYVAIKQQKVNLYELVGEAPF